MSQQQGDVIDNLQEENRVLRQQLGGKRLRLSDEQRRLSRTRTSAGYRLEEFEKLAQMYGLKGLAQNPVRLTLTNAGNF